jgi:hypothetical protein
MMLRRAADESTHGVTVLKETQKRAWLRQIELHEALHHFDSRYGPRGSRARRVLCEHPAIDLAYRSLRSAKSQRPHYTRKQLRAELFAYVGSDVANVFGVSNAAQQCAYNWLTGYFYLLLEQRGESVLRALPPLECGAKTALREARYAFARGWGNPAVFA